MSNQERRATQRVPLKATVNVLQEGKHLATDISAKDISLDGINLHTSSPLPMSQICDLEITISGPSSVLQLRAKGKVLRDDLHSAAIKFTELDIDTYMHLKNIVNYQRAPENSITS